MSVAGSPRRHSSCGWSKYRIFQSSSKSRRQDMEGKGRTPSLPRPLNATPSFQDVPSSIVKLLVIENLMLQPCVDVYILPLSFVDYRVERRKHGHVETVPLPSDQHSLQLTNTSVAELNARRSRVTGLVLGFTEVVLQDKSILSYSEGSPHLVGTPEICPLNTPQGFFQEGAGRGICPPCKNFAPSHPKP